MGRENFFKKKKFYTYFFLYGTHFTTEIWVSGLKAAIEHIYKYMRQHASQLFITKVGERALNYKENTVELLT